LGQWPKCHRSDKSCAPRKATTIAEREAIADDVVRRLAAKRDDPSKLNEELPTRGPAIGHGSPEGWIKGRE
jgi:hypothetical protein